MLDLVESLKIFTIINYKRKINPQIQLSTHPFIYQRSEIKNPDKKGEMGISCSAIPIFITPDGSPRQTDYFISSESSWAPETVPNNGLLRQVEMQKKKLILANDCVPRGEDDPF